MTHASAPQGHKEPARPPIHERSRFKSAGLIVGIAAGVVSLLGGVLAIVWHYSSTGNTSPASESTGGVLASRTLGSRSGSEVSPVSIGACLSGSGIAVPCDAVHRFEVASEAGSPCMNSALISYLGGDPALDVILVNAETHVVSPNASACVLSSVDNHDRTGSVKDVLTTPDGDQWRRCIDDRLQRKDVPCSVPHTGEYVGFSAGSAPNVAACEIAAEKYMATTMPQVSGQLDISALRTVNVNDDLPRCLISVRGDNVLTSSLRRIGANALPLEASN